MTDRPDGPGEKKSRRLGVREIAKRVGVAPMTVSRALSNPDMVSPETRAKVLQAIEQAGFVPNRLASSMRGNGRMIGTVVPPLINSGIAEQVQGMSDECHESGYSMLLVQGEFTQEAEEKSIRTLLGWRPVGMILLLGWSWALFYHLCNGIRHLIQDTGAGYAIPQFVRSSWLSIAGSIVLTVLVWAYVLTAGGAA